MRTYALNKSDEFIIFLSKKLAISLKLLSDYFHFNVYQLLTNMDKEMVELDNKEKK